MNAGCERRKPVKQTPLVYRGSGFSNGLPLSRRLNAPNGGPRRPQILEIVVNIEYSTDPPNNFPYRLFLGRRPLTDSLWSLIPSTIILKATARTSTFHHRGDRSLADNLVASYDTAKPPTYASGLAPMTR
jgi:hypothetical protein